MKVPSNWTFKSDEIATHFDEHVREQLPWYDLATSAVVTIARHYIHDKARVYDLGASTGNIGRALSDVLRDRDAHFEAIEVSREMVKQYNGPGKMINRSIIDVEPEQFDLAVAFLVFMFLPPDKVEPTLQVWTQAIKPGGALIIVERFLPPAGYLSIVNSRLTLTEKLNAGVDPLEIIEKELSLAGAQRPLNHYMIEAFGGVEFFRFGDFAGYIIERER